MLRKKKKYPWPYLEFLASCSVAEHHPQGATGIEPRYGALTASQVHWLHSSMWLSLLLWLMFIFARWVQTLQTAKRNISKKKIFIFRYLLNNKTIHQLPAVPALFQIMQSLLLLSSHVPLVKKIRGDQNRTWLDLNHPPKKYFYMIWKCFKEGTRSHTSPQPTLTQKGKDIIFVCWPKMKKVNLHPWLGKKNSWGTWPKE